MTDVSTDEWIDTASRLRHRTIARVLQPLEFRRRGAMPPVTPIADARAAGDANAHQADTIAQLRAALAAARPLIDVTHPRAAQVHRQVEDALAMGMDAVDWSAMPARMLAKPGAGHRPESNGRPGDRRDPT